MKPLFLALAVTLYLSGYSQWAERRYTTEDLIYNSPFTSLFPVRINLNLQTVKLHMDLTSRKQADSIPKLDSLLKVVLNDILPIAYGEKKPSIIRRIDYLTGSNGTFRVVEHQPQGITYRKEKGKVVEGKVDNDTLQIQLYTQRFVKEQPFPRRESYYIMFTYPDVKFLTQLRPSLLDSAVGAVRQEIHNETGHSTLNLYGGYQYQFKSSTYSWQPLKGEHTWTAHYTFEPDIQVGFQYARGSWIPSAAAGIQYAKEDGQGMRDMFELFWEPYFNFSRDINNRVVTDRNDFITFKYYHYEGKNEKSIDLPPSNFSLGYLVRRRGDLFQKHTFKFTIPGVHYKYLWLEPEFFFNDFFKNFSPSLKMTFEID